MSLAALPHESTESEHANSPVRPPSRLATEFFAAASTTLGIAIFVLYLAAVLGRWGQASEAPEPLHTALILSPLPVMALAWWGVSLRMPASLASWVGMGIGVVIALVLFAAYLVWLIPFTVV